MSSENNLFDEFPPISRKQWEKTIENDLKGANYKIKLKWNTGEGIDVLPFYRREDLATINSKGPISKKVSDKEANSWEIRESIFGNSIQAANKSARKALQSGADALQFSLRIDSNDSENVGGEIEGLSIQRQSDFSQLLDGIDIETTPLHFDAGMASPGILAMLWNEINSRDLNFETIEATFLYDPFVSILQNGYLPKDEEGLKKDFGKLAEFTTHELPGVHSLGIDARFYHNCGGTIVQELAYTLATASEYLSILTDRDFQLENIVKCVHFNFSIGSSYFLEIAKFRAARILWQNLLEAYGTSTDQPAYIHGQTSEWNKTIYDPYTNMLRTSTETMSAAIGGCDSITVLPFDESFRKTNEFSQRIARNQQILFSEEAYLDKVADPSAGSYYIEKLTDKIGEQAWRIFQEIEAEGGFIESIKSGTVQMAIKDSKDQRDQNIATRRRIFTGTNQYATTEERKSKTHEPTAILEESDSELEVNSETSVQGLAKALSQSATLGDIIPALFNRGKHKYNTITPYRGPEAFEMLRQHTEQHESTPKVLILPLGEKKMRMARSTFTANFFNPAGYDIVNPLGFETIEKAINKIRSERPDITVLCSSDKEYEHWVPKLSRKLNNLDQRPIFVLAGYPKDQIEQYRQAGIDLFIHAKCNVLETLNDVQQRLGVK